MRAAFDEKTFRLLFRISLLLKGAFSLLEIVGGVLAYYVSQQYLLHLVTTITQEELTEDPRDFVAHFLSQSAQQLSVSAQHFAAFYLLSHGVIKTGLIVGSSGKALVLPRLNFGIRDLRRLSTFPISGHPLAVVVGNNNSRHCSHSYDLARIPISASV